MWPRITLNLQSPCFCLYLLGPGIIEQICRRYYSEEHLGSDSDMRSEHRLMVSVSKAGVGGSIEKDFTVPIL